MPIILWRSGANRPFDTKIRGLILVISLAMLQGRRRKCVLYKENLYAQLGEPYENFNWMIGSRFALASRPAATVMPVVLYCYLYTTFLKTTVT